MAMPPVPLLVAVSVAVYRRLLRAYPPGFRRAYGPQMVHMFRDCCQDAYRRTGARGVLWVWLAAGRDLITNVVAEYGTTIRTWYRAWRAGREGTPALTMAGSGTAPALVAARTASRAAPALLSLRGSITPDTLDATVDAVRNGAAPGWRIAYDQIGIEMVRGRGRDIQRDRPIQWTLGSDLMPAHVWVLIVEEEATRRREVLKFQLVGDEERPLWLRIRPDASLPPSGLPV